MTECERIIKNGILPESFFEPEWICDFYVDEKRKKIWAVELDILRKIHEVCEKHNLIYFLNWGSLLGAVRHNGFVPWDDDLDIMMPRDDYDRFLALQAEFDEPYFLQIPCEDDGFYYAHARVRNSNTSALDYPFIFQNFNHGMFVDVLPIDNTDLIVGKDLFEEGKRLININSVAMRLTHPKPLEKDIERIHNHNGENPKIIFEKINQVMNHLRDVDTDYATIYAATVYGFERGILRKSWINDRKPITLYGIDTYIPEKSEEVLKIEYGDYLKLPPVEARGAWHGNIYFDPDVSYKNILFLKRNELINN